MNRHDPRLAVMPPADFEASLQRLGLNHSSAARWMGADRRSIVRWATGVIPIPSTIKLMLQLAESLHDLGAPVPGAAQALRRRGRQPAVAIPAE